MSAVTVGVRHALRVVLLAVVTPAVVSSGGFPIAATAVSEDTNAVAFDGTNFLVAIRGGGLRAQLVSPSGALLGTVLLPRSGDPELIAFDGTNYLLVWREPTTPPPDGPGIYGQLISKQATTVGATFRISQSTTTRELDGVAFDGTRYLVVWSNTRPLVSERDIYGRFVSTAGVPEGNDFEIDDGAGIDASLAFGASSYLVVWNEDVANTEIRGRFVTPAGVLQSAFTVNGSSAASDNPGTVAFDGTNFLVVWADAMGGLQELDFFGQLVSPAAALVGSPIPIATAPGNQLLPYIAFDGINYLITWTDLANDANLDFACDPGEGTCADVYGQLVSPAGTLVGTNFAVEVDAGNQGQSPVAYGAGKYLVAWSQAFDTPNGDVYGAFVPATSTAPAPVFRLRHPTIGAYLYTVYPSERDSATSQFGYIYEGICCNWFTTPATDGRTELYRLFSGTAGEYFFTIYASERDAAVAEFSYLYEGVAAYCNPTATPAAPREWFRLRYGNKHFYTIYAEERDAAVDQFGYVYEGVACYLPPL